MTAALTRWKHALRAATAARRDINALGVGAHADVLGSYRLSLTRFLDEMEASYAALTTDDRAVADRLLLEMTP